MKKKLLDRIDVKAPCNEGWEEMTGNDSVRFCSHCSKNVYDLSSMTRSRAERLVRESNGRLCVRYFRDEHGKVVTAPVGLTQIGRRATVAAGVFAASLSLSSFGQAQEMPVKMGEVKSASQKDPRSSRENQIGNSGILGRVLDLSEAGVVGATVTLLRGANEVVSISKSDDNGRYVFKGLEPGVFSLRVVAPNFATFTLKDIDVAEDTVLEKDVILEAGTVGELVIIEGPIETVEPQVQSTIQSRQLVELPLQARSFTLGLIAVAPEKSETPRREKKKKNRLPK